MPTAPESPSTSLLVSARRWVVKVGSSLLVDPGSGRLDRAWLSTLAADVATMHRRGQEVLLVSSGAIALGRRHLGLAAGRLRLEESQAAAAVGQIRLAHAYEEILGEHGIEVAQVLLTLGDTEERRRYLNARATIGTLLGLGAVPVVNENDTVATSEIRYGDNDRLAARVAQMVGADGLVLLSDVDGLYTADPAGDPAARRIAEVREITPEIAAMAGGVSSDFGTGGMVTKIEAARIALAAGCRMCVTLGRVAHPLARLEGGAPATWFVPSTTPPTTRKQWIAGALRPAGELHLDAGASAALRRGKSLLPAGIVRIVGRFERGDAVVLRDPSGTEIGRGLSAYSSADAERIRGRRSAEIEALLGFRGRDEVVHRDDLVLAAEGRGRGGRRSGRGRSAPEEGAR